MIKCEPVECCVCQETITPRLVLENKRDGWHIMRCPQCALAFIHPQPPPEKISAYYNGMYSDLAAEFSEEKMEWAKRSVNGYCAHLAELHPKANSLLDLGGGLGYYSKAFSEAGYTVTMVEQDPVSARFAKEQLQLDEILELSDDRFFEENERRYDVVFMRHVIEHSTSPDTMISKVAECLADDGILIIETDNNAGIELLFRPGTAAFYTRLYRAAFDRTSYFRLFRARPFALDPPRHLFSFRNSNLSRLLKNHSIQPMKSICYRLGHPVYWPNMPVPSLRDFIGYLRKGQVAHLAATVVDWLFFPVRLILEQKGMASGICLYARKGSGNG